MATCWTASNLSPVDEGACDESAVCDHDVEERGGSIGLREVGSRVRLQGGEEPTEHRELYHAPDRGAHQRGRECRLALHRADRDSRHRAISEGPRLTGGTGADPPALRALSRAAEEYLLLDGNDRRVIRRRGT